LTLLILLGAVAGCSSLTPADDPVYLRLTDVEARLMRIERVVENESLIELATEIQALRNDVRALRGDVETLQFNTENAAERQRDLYVDLDERLRQIEEAQAAAPVVAAAPAASGVAAAAAPVNDQQAYDQAFEMIQARQYEQAASAFNNFLATYPGSLLRDNAQYWLAETHYVRREFTTALPAFQTVIDDYPQSAKLPDALLKIGYCNYELQNWDAARQALQQVTRLYPDTTAARLAEQRLDRIAQEAG
jgi:tol-pal system protein YbgF